MKDSPQATLSTLPAELLVLILSFLKEPKDIVPLELVSKFFHEFVRGTDDLWKAFNTRLEAIVPAKKDKEKVDDSISERQHFIKQFAQANKSVESIKWKVDLKKITHEEFNTLMHFKRTVKKLESLEEKNKCTMELLTKYGEKRRPPIPLLEARDEDKYNFTAISHHPDIAASILVGTWSKASPSPTTTQFTSSSQETHQMLRETATKLVYQVANEDEDIYENKKTNRPGG